MLRERQPADLIPMIHESTLEVPARLEALASISNFVVDAARGAGLDEHAVWEVQLAVDEAVTNAIVHGYHEHELRGTLSISIAQEDGKFVVSLRDQGAPFDPSRVPEPDLVSPLEQRKTGGLGLFLMRKLMDDITFEREANVNVLRMTKRLPPSGLRYIALSGRIDASAAPTVQRTVHHAMKSGGRWIVVDMAQVTFLSSSGLRALLMLNREMQKSRGDLRLCSLQPHVAEVFHLTGFDQIFPLYSSRHEAAASFPQA